jgi:pantothenate synthetase
MKKMISKIDSANHDYVKIVKADNFELVDELIKGREYFVLVACKIGKTRLIDNLVVTV